MDSRKNLKKQPDICIKSLNPEYYTGKHARNYLSPKLFPQIWSLEKHREKNPQKNDSIKDNFLFFWEKGFVVSEPS